MSTYAIVRLPDDDEDIMVPADDFEVTESGELQIFRNRPNGDGTSTLRLWAQFSTYLGCYLVDEEDAISGGKDDEDDGDAEPRGATSVAVPVTATEAPALVGSNHGAHVDETDVDVN